MKRKLQAGQPDGTKKQKSSRGSAAKGASISPAVKDSKSAREQAEPYCLATVKFPIDALTPAWSMGANRPVDEAHKRSLVELFKQHGLHRCDVSNRLLVACAREDFEKMNDAMGWAMSANAADNFSVYVGEVGLREPGWPYFKDWMRVVGEKAELMAGNHRVEALKELLGGSEDGDGKDERWWLCELYDKDALPSSLYVNLRANREDVLLPDSHGQIWAEMATLASRDNTLFKGNARELETEMIASLGLVGRTKFPTKRLVTLWRNKNWKRMITELCSFPVGQALFSISAFEWMASCRIDDFWFTFFNKAINAAKRVRQGYNIEIEPRDWVQLARISETSSHGEIMALFYPQSVGDPYASELGPRRHDLLLSLDDDKYKEFYHHILTRSDLRFPDVHLLMKTTKREGKVMSVVMTHIGYWLNNTPAVVQDRNDANKPLLRTVFLPALQKKFDRNAIQKSIELEFQVLTCVRKHMGSLTDKAAGHFLEIFPTGTDHDYNERFNYKPWLDILILVHGMAGPHFENESMARFNHDDPKMIKSKPLADILRSICHSISKSPEITQSSVLSGKAAIQSLHDTLGPIIAKWAVEQCDKKALQLSSDDHEPAELAQVRAERTKYAALQGVGMDIADGPSSRDDDSIDLSSEKSDKEAADAVSRDDVQQATPTLVRQALGGLGPRRTGSGFLAPLNDEACFVPDVGSGHGVADKESPLAVRGGGPASQDDVGRGQVESGRDQHDVAIRVDVLPKALPRVPKGARNSWRRRPVAQPSAPPQP